MSLHGQSAATQREEERLLRWLNAASVAYLGDDPDGVWMIFAQVGDSPPRLETLA